MRMFNKILVAVDGSEFSINAAKTAIDLAVKYRAELIAVAVVPISIPGGTVGEVEELKTEGEKRLGKVLEKVKLEAARCAQSLKTEILYGHIADSIVKYAFNSNADLVVVGYKGSSAVKEFLLGSVATKVIHHAHCSVMLVKD